MKIKFNIDFKYALLLFFAAGICGTISSILTKLGNPVDGGVSISCFLRDIGGAFGLHGVLQFSYLRPEIPGIFLVLL